MRNINVRELNTMVKIVCYRLFVAVNRLASPFFLSILNIIVEHHLQCVELDNSFDVQ